MELLLLLLLHLLQHRLETSDDRVFSSDARGDKVLTVAAGDDDGSQRPPASRPARAGGNPNQNGRAEREAVAANRRSCYCCGATW
ncbi:unnamed protein product [Sphagnum tenellum]